MITLVFFANAIKTTTNTALGVSQIIMFALGCTLLEEAIRSIQVVPNQRDGMFVSANGALLRRGSMKLPDQTTTAVCLRDFSVSLAISSIVSGIVLGVVRFDGFHEPHKLSDVPWHSALRILIVTAIGIGRYVLTMLAVSRFPLFPTKCAYIFKVARYGSYDTSLVYLVALVLAQVANRPSLSAVFYLLAGSSALLCSSTDLLVETFGASIRHSIGSRRVIMVLVLIFLAWISISSLSPRTRNAIISEISDIPLHDTKIVSTAAAVPAIEYTSTTTHPIRYLISEARRTFDDRLSGQSKSLSEAVAEYKHRYRLPPPPHFDKWYELATKRNVQFIDEYDTIFESLLPFWSLKPATIRARVTEAIGYENNGFIALMIRDGSVVKIEGGPDWQRHATVGMIKDFVNLLPDMDLAFNVHDEPRIVIPHDELSRMVSVALNEAIPSVLKGGMGMHNSFSTAPHDLGDGKSIKEVKVTRFNEYAHQHTWGASRLSCSVDSPSRSVEDDMKDNTTAFSFSEFGFVHNHTAFSDICNSPSLRRNYGFFDRPNAFKVSHELIPIFSQSKLSSFQDILYPSPWYWSGTISTDDLAIMHMDAQVEYQWTKDVAWDIKDDKFWWRGSTTGGFSRAGGWRRQHRQHFVKNINGYDKTKILQNKGTLASPEWTTSVVSKTDYASLLDIKFSHVGQCDPGDCDAQREFFEIAPAVPMQPEAWRHKHLLDIDGNAFSGRFYAFLKSTSLVYKASIFREWHMDWIVPWVHYIPLTFKGYEHIETVRYLAQDEEGKTLAPKLALAGQDWARKALRDVDMEVWMFRLLLEYGRLIDDNRDSVGFDIS